MGLLPVLREQFEVELAVARDLSKAQLSSFDTIYLSFWDSARWADGLEKLLEPELRRVIAGVHSHYSLEDPTARLTTPSTNSPPSQRSIDTLSRFGALVAISPRLADLLRPWFADIRYVRAGVDPGLFRPNRTFRSDGRLRVGWAGSRVNQPGNRGIEEILVPISRLPGIDLVLRSDPPSRDSFESMPSFYNSLDLYACASRSEGASTGIREAMSCGVPVMTTSVGDVPELVEHDRTGWILPRNESDFLEVARNARDNIQSLRKMGACARLHILEHWTWREVAADWMLAFSSVHKP